MPNFVLVLLKCVTKRKLGIVKCTFIFVLQVQMAEGLFLRPTKVKISLLVVKSHQLAKEFITPVICLLLD